MNTSRVVIYERKGRLNLRLERGFRICIRLQRRSLSEDVATKKNLDL